MPPGQPFEVDHVSMRLAAKTPEGSCLGEHRHRGRLILMIRRNTSAKKPSSTCQLELAVLRRDRLDTDAFLDGFDPARPWGIISTRALWDTFIIVPLGAR
jgi:hypothetical protein